MVLTVECYGMILGVYNRREGSATMMLMAESVASQSMPHLPYHHALLVAERGDIDLKATTLTPLPAASELADFDALRITDPIVWEISGHEVVIGQQRTGRGSNVKLKKSGAHGKFPVKNDWSDHRWIPDLSKIQPGCKLKERPSIGKKVKSIVKLLSGEISGGEPHPKWEGANWTWAFSPEYSQAVSDHIAFRSDHPIIEIDPGTIHARSIRLNGKKRSVVLKVLHEARPAETKTEARLVRLLGSPAIDGGRSDEKRPFMTHFAAFYDMLTGLEYEHLGNPVAIWQWRDFHPVGPLEDTPYCIMGLLFE